MTDTGKHQEWLLELEGHIRLAEHKIDQTLQGGLGLSKHLGVALSALRSAWRLLDAQHRIVQSAATPYKPAQNAALMLRVIVPLTPPSVNHYMRTMVMKGSARHYPTAEAKAWWRAVGVCFGGRSVQAKDFEIAYVVYQGSKERGDVDNYSKCIFDGLVKAGVIDSDHKVFAMHAYKGRDRNNPRTEIFIRECGQINLLDPPMPRVDEW